jgi:hypothetical protein
MKKEECTTTNDLHSFRNRKTLTRLNTAVMLVLVSSGLAACAIGALIYYVGRLLLAG